MRQIPPLPNVDDDLIAWCKFKFPNELANLDNVVSIEDAGKQLFRYAGQQDVICALEMVKKKSEHGVAK